MQNDESVSLNSRCSFYPDKNLGPVSPSSTRTKRPDLQGHAALKLQTRRFRSSLCNVADVGARTLQGQEAQPWSQN